MKQIKRLQIISAVSLLLAVSALFVNVYLQHTRTLEEKEYEKLRKETVQTEKKTDAQPEHDFAALKKQNEDIYAWIKVEQTLVDYPVLQGKEDNYYLNHDVNHNEAASGAIYSNSCNATDMVDRITILYGHDMKADTMFGSLHLFDEADFLEKNHTMTIETQDCLRTYEIVGVYNYNDDYLPAKFDVTSEEGVLAFQKALQLCAQEKNEITHVREAVEITKKDKLLVLSTCIPGQDERRFLVVGILKNTERFS